MLRFTDRNINPLFPRQVGAARHFSPRFSSAKKAFLQTSLGTSRPLKFRLLVLLCAFNMISNVCRMIFPYMYFAHCIISFDTLLTVPGMFSHWAGESWSEICHFLCKYSHLYANIKWLLMSPIHKESNDQENCFHHGHRVSFLNIFNVFLIVGISCGEIVAMETFLLNKFYYFLFPSTCLARGITCVVKYNSVLSTEQIPHKLDVDCLDLRTV